ncbi:EAL domain-containing protein [Clostridium sp. DL1XJH146]
MLTLYMILSAMYLVLSFSIFTKDSRWVNRCFALMALNLSFFSFMSGWYTIRMNNYNGRFMFLVLIILDIIFYYNMLIFVILLTEHQNWFNKLWKKIVFSLPMLVAIYVYTIWNYDPLEFSTVIRGEYLFKNIQYGYFYNTYFYIYYSVVGILSLVLLLNWYIKATLKRKKRQAMIIFIATILALIVGTVIDYYVLPSTEGINLDPARIVPHIDPFMVIITAIPCIAITYAMKKYKMMNVEPKSLAVEIAGLMYEGIFVLNHKGVIEYANDGARKMLGFENKELLNQNISLVIKKDYEKLKVKNINSREIKITTKDNKEIPVLLSSTMSWDDFDEIVSIVLIFQNISQMKDIQNKVIEMNNDLEKIVTERTNNLNKTNKKLEVEILKRIDVEKDIKFMANHDYLTGLSNRRYLMEQFTTPVDPNEKLAIIYMDIDSFKNINDSLGHTIGDEILLEVGNRLNKIIKKPSIVGRIGGDEFLFLINDFKSSEELVKILDDILHCFDDTFEIEQEKIAVSTSLGVAIYPEDGEDFVTLMKNADISLYSAKAEGKKRYKICSEELKEQVNEELKLISNLENALENKEIEAYYQPKVNQSTGKIIGFEALARWNNSEFGAVSPVKFIPIAEKTGIIVEIGEYILRTACERMKIWVDRGYNDWVMSANISVIQIRKDNFVERIKLIIDQTGLEYKNLELEVTESLLIKNNDSIINKLVELQNMGIKISMDDFGTEYSSLSYLKYLPVNKIKIAREFVSQININKKDEAIIKLTLNLIKEFGFEVIAEGVETLEQAEFLRKLGCDEIQGYYYYKPMPWKLVEMAIEEKEIEKN